MAVTDLTVVSNQIQKFWSPIFTKELRENTLLPGLVSKDYQGEIKLQGDTVRVSQINAPKGSLKTIGTDADVFDSEQLSTSYVDIVANKRAVASLQFTDLSQLQSQIQSESSDIRASLQFAVEKQMNDYLYSLAAPAASQILTGVDTMTAAQLITIRNLAAKAKWNNMKPWYLLADPGYFGDLLSAQTMTSRDYIGDDQAPTIAGQIPNKRFGFNILEDNSRPGNSTTKAKFALAFHPDYLCLCMQRDVTFKISDLHPTGKFGYVLSVDVVFGAALGVAGAAKHITAVSTS